MQFQLDVYSHFVKVTGFDKRGKEALFEFCKPLGEMGLVRVAPGRFIKKMVRVYAAATKDRREFRFHVNQLRDLVQHLKRYVGHESAITIDYHMPVDGEPAKFKIRKHLTPFDYQIGIRDYLSNDQKINVLTLQTGKGKAQPLHANIRVPGGWMKMGEMTVGQKVIAKDGTVCEVTGVYPQGVKDIYRITFADGRTAECCEEHLWKVYRPNRVWDWKIVDTKEMIRLKALRNNRLYIDLIDPEIGIEADLPIPPYTMGALLGDGHIGEYALGFSTADDQVLENIKAELPVDMEIIKRNGNNYDYYLRRAAGYRSSKNTYLDALSRYGLKRKLSHEKFIPDEYLEASHKQRLALMQGLMDTDGTTGKEGSTLFCTTSLRLAEQIVYLARSLGAMAKIRTKEPHYMYAGERRKGKIAYIVQFRHKRPTELFRLSRKIARVNDGNQYAPTLKLRVDHIEKVSREPAQCISISHPERLYVTDDFVVTHNTLCSFFAVEVMQKRTLLIVKAQYIDQWIKNYEETMDGSKKDLMVVKGSKHLRMLIDLAVHNQMDAKFIIISSTTMYNYIQEYEQFSPEEFSYPVVPDQLCQVLGVHTRIIDEAHSMFHLNFRLDLYTHVCKTINLSATMESDDKFKNKMYEIAYPLDCRYRGMQYDKYISVKALFYSLNDIRRVRFKAIGRGSYSHIEYEKSLMRKPNKVLLENYFDLIADCVEMEYIRLPRQAGQKMLIFVASKMMATLLQQKLQAIYTELKVSRFIDEDPYHTVLESDIIVSTLLSAGTAIDIPGLAVALMTTALGSRQLNEQAVGRLRRLKDWPEVTPRFLYFVCDDIDKHIEYHERKKEYFADKVLSQKEEWLSRRV